jgi:hypothetical protein
MGVPGVVSLAGRHWPTVTPIADSGRQEFSMSYMEFSTDLDVVDVTNGLRPGDLAIKWAIRVRRLAIGCTCGRGFGDHALGCDLEGK